VRKISVLSALLLAACGTAPVTTPIYHQSFTVTGSAYSGTCSGVYYRSGSEMEITVPVQCSDGRTGAIAIRTNEIGHPQLGTMTLADESVVHATFRPILGDRHAYADAANLSAPTPAYLAAIKRQRTSIVRSSAVTSSGSIYMGNCPTPDSYDSAGRRCGARSAASRAGGYTPRYYSSGRTYVRGHYRKGRYVRSHYRRR